MATQAPTPSILQIAETGQADALHAELLAKSNSSLYYFTKVVMNYRDLTDDFHLPFCERIQEDIPYVLNGYLLGRAHFKSTIRTKCYSLWRYLQDHEQRILVIGESDTVAKKNFIDIRWHILNNQLLRWLYPELTLIDPNAMKWTESEMLLPREGTYDEPTFTADGIGAKRTGFHYTEIIFDDPVGDKAAASDSVMESAWEWIEYSRGLLHDPAKSKRTWVGTRWKHGIGDIYGKLMQRMPECRWYIRAAIENGNPVFPQRFSLKTLADIRNEQGDYKFNCQYMNNPTTPGSTDFEADWLQEYDVADDGITIVPCDGSPSVRTDQLMRMSFYDPSAGGKSANCENAICIAGMDITKRIFALEGWAENTSIGRAVEHWHLLNDRWKCFYNFYELVGAQKAVEDFCYERRKQTECPYCDAGHLHEGKFLRNPHKVLRPVAVKPPGGKIKEERIILFAQKPAEERRIYLRRGMTKLRNQIIEFPHSPLLDLFDTLAYLCHYLKPPISQDDLESAKGEVQRKHALAQPRTHVSQDYGGY